MIKRMNAGRYQHPQRDDGMALVLVLWILMLLTVLAFEFSVMTRTETKVTLNQRESTEAYYLARAGIYKAIAELSRPVMSEPDEEEENFTTQNPLPDIDPLEAPWRPSEAPPTTPQEGRWKPALGRPLGRPLGRLLELARGSLPDVPVRFFVETEADP